MNIHLFSAARILATCTVSSNPYLVNLTIDPKFSIRLILDSVVAYRNEDLSINNARKSPIYLSLFLLLYNHAYWRASGNCENNQKFAFDETDKVRIELKITTAPKKNE